MSAASMMSSCTRVALWMNSTTAASRIDARRNLTKHPGGQQKQHRTDSFTAAVKNVFADLRDGADVGTCIASQFFLDLRRVQARPAHRDAVDSKQSSRKRRSLRCFRRRKQPREIARRISRAAASSGDIPAAFARNRAVSSDERRFIPLPSMRHRRQIRTVGFDQQTIRWNGRRNLRQIRGHSET